MAEEKPKTDQRSQHKELMSGMKVGDSFFVAGYAPADLTYVRQLGYRLNIRLSIRFVVQDAIYGKAGTRVARTA